MLRPVSLPKIFEPDAQPEPRMVGRKSKRLGEYELPESFPLVAMHIMALAGIVLALMGRVPWQVWAFAFISYWIRMWGVTAGFHRYFSHRTFKTSRVFQFILAVIAQTASQRGALWWAAHHRDHHKYSDQERDVHSPVQHGLLHSHLGWIYDYNGATDYARVKDLTKFPELVMLNKVWALEMTLLGLVSYLWMGWAGLLVGFALSTVVLMHCTFTINSLAHVWGKRRYANTGDDSRNNWVLALITLGEGWHNNHHHFMNSTRQGFYWWEIDVTYYSLKVLSWVGIVWDLKEPPARVYDADLRATPAASADGESASLEAA